MHDLRHIYFYGAESSAPTCAPPSRGAVSGALPGARDGVRVSDAEAVQLDPFMAWMLRQAGLPPQAYRTKPLHRRLPACLRTLRAATPGAARALLERDAELLPAALNSVLIGVTEFFRDRAVFDALRTELLPALLRTRPGLRVCSVGASEGQELYSMAILLGEAGVLERSELLGLDCRSDAIERARAGAYRSEEMAGVDEAWRTRYFLRNGARWTVRAAVRHRVAWRVADLFAASADGKWDVILFRNVAIYLDEAHAAPVWERLCARLSPGGILVTGKAEKPPADLPLRRLATSVYALSTS